MGKIARKSRINPARSALIEVDSPRRRQYMQNNVFGTVLHHIRNLVVPETGRELSDAQLVERFAGQREESAFAALVHAPWPVGLDRLPASAAPRA